jgi:hypothetical protein
MHEPAVSHGRQEKRQRKFPTQNPGSEIALRFDYRVTRPEGDIVEDPAVLPQGDFAFRAAIEVVKDCLRNSPLRCRSKIINANDAW